MGDNCLPLVANLFNQRLGTHHAAAILNISSGISFILNSLFLYLVDEFFGHFLMLLMSSISYSSGVAFIAMSTPPALGNLTGMCKEYRSECVGHTHKVLFYIGLALLTVGKLGHHVSLGPLLQLQHQDDNIFSKKRFLFPFLALNTLGFVIPLVIPSISIPASIQYGLAAVSSIIGMLLFLSFSRVYKKIPPAGSPMVNVCRVYKRYLYSMHIANDRWKVSSLDELEEAKIVIRMIPMWMTVIVCGIVQSMETTYFVEQENNMNRQIGKWNAPVQAPLIITKLLRSSVRNHGLVENPGADIPMAYYWLLFQFFLIAAVEMFLEHSFVAFGKCEAPESLRGYLDHFREGMLGIGYILSVSSVHVVGRISEKGGRPNWFQSTLNKSRLDNYYWVLAVICSLNLLVFIFVACRFRYTIFEDKDVEAHDGGNEV